MPHDLLSTNASLTAQPPARPASGPTSKGRTPALRLPAGRTRVIDFSFTEAKFEAPKECRRRCVAAYADAEEALAQISRALPDVVFLDLRLPGMSGTNFLRQLKVRHPTVRVLAYTQHFECDVVEGAKATNHPVHTVNWYDVVKWCNARSERGRLVPANLLVTNQAGVTFDLTIHPNLTNAGQLKPTGPVNIVGVLTQNDPSAPYTADYSLLPTEIQSEPSGIIQFVATNLVLLESGPAITLSVSRTGGSSGPVSASYSAADGTTQGASDFIATGGVLSWATGETDTKTIIVQLVNDSAGEADAVLTVGLSSVALGLNTTAVIAILNDDFVTGRLSLTLIT